MRRRRRHQPSRAALVADDATRAVRYLEAVLADARRLGVQPDEGVLACLVVLRAWGERIVTREEPEPPD
jgi:hypothetical protein